MKENMEYFFESLAELQNTIPELYARYSHNNLLIEPIIDEKTKRWIVRYVKRDGDIESKYVSEEEGVYPVLKLIAKALLDTLAENREALKHAETGQNVIGEQILRESIIRFITNNFMLHKYEELNTDGRILTKKMIADVQSFRESSLQSVNTTEARRILSILHISHVGNGLYKWELKQKTTGGVESLTLENDVIGKTDLFIVTSYCHEMLRMLQKKIKNFCESDDFYKDAIFLIEKIEKFEATF